jgi:ribosomal protein L37AE/L43A
MVGYKSKEKEKGDIIPKMTEIMQDVRMPLFCKECNKVMKKRLDDKMWRL